MCGIAGFCDLNRDSNERGQTIRRMTDHMRERGPDADGMAIYEYAVSDGRTVGVTFGHRRLAIIDLTGTGAQPMDSHSGRYSAVYNGEIYDHLEIKSELESCGAVSPSEWRGTSDTEILLEAIETWGIEEALKKCRGMFAFALFDRETGKLSLARDRVGEKPLYYGFVRGSFVFASDIGCFREIQGLDNGIHKDVLPLYFVHGDLPAPYTIYEDIWKLMPGTILTLDPPYEHFDPSEDMAVLMEEKYHTGDRIDGKNHSYTVYYSMKDAAEKGAEEPFTGSLEEASDKLEELLTEAIRRQMIADVPLGAFLSAGIDSPTIVSLMQKVSRSQGGMPVRTFTIGMREKGFNEAEIAAQIAEHLGTEHTEKYITKEDALAVVPKLAHMFGEPFADSSQIPTYLVSAMTREHVTVSLSGDAGDELFCGYTSYTSIDRIWGKMRGLPYGIRKLASSAALMMPGIRDREIPRTKATLLAAKGPVELHRLESDHEPVISQIAGHPGKGLPYAMTALHEDHLPECNRLVMLSDMLLYHPDDILVKVDRCAMAVSLETRVPLLDPDVIEFAWSLPLEHLIEYRNNSDGTSTRIGKRILRNILYRYVPKELMDRPKKGFSIPVEKWLLEEPLHSWAAALIAPDKLEREGLLNADAVGRMWEDYEKRGIFRVQLWYVLMLEEWLAGVQGDHV